MEWYHVHEIYATLLKYNGKVIDNPSRKPGKGKHLYNLVYIKPDEHYREALVIESPVRILA